MDFLTSFFGRAGFLPHGYCFTWTPGLLWAMVVADCVIVAAYFSIPAAILSFVHKRGDASLRWVAVLFSAFIFSCGLTHVMDVWTIWRPDYGLQALSKLVTAAISFVTAVALWTLIPKALRLPSVERLQAVILSLESEVGRRTRAEDQVMQVQQTLAIALASIGAGFIATDRAGRVVRMNDVAERATGWRESAAAGQELWSVFVRAALPEADVGSNPVDVMIRAGVGVESVRRVVVVSRLGPTTPVDLQADLTRAPDGTVLGMAIVFRDVTRLVAAEADASLLAAIVASSSDAIVGKALDGTITSWNGGAATLFGHAAAEAIGRSVNMLIPANLQSDENRIRDELSHGHPVPAFDTVRLRRDGEPVEVSLAISPIRDTGERIVGASMIARDISRQKSADAALRDSEERLRFTLEAAHIGDWELELATGVMRHSLRHDRCFGYPEQQAAWSFDKFVEHVHPDDRAEVEQTLHVAVTEHRDWRVQCRVVWPDSSVHWISKHGSVQHKGGKAVRMLGIVSEITEQRQAEDARLRAQRLEAENRQIQEANRLKSQFLANMSHELRTPLNAVIGFADLLHSGFIKPEAPQHQEYLGHIGTSGRHLLQLINDVLDLSKVESGKFDFFPEAVDLPALFKEVRDILHMAIQRKNVRVDTDIAPDLNDIRLDPARLKQVLYNYLSNAIKFTAVGGHVTVRAMPEGVEHFRIEVEDTGIGIAAEDLPRLFTEFQQLDAGYSKQHQGTGLGLALTRRLVEAQGGSVGVRSAFGVGSVFHVVLNRVHGMDTQRRASAAQDAQAIEADRVLVIEHDQRDQTRLVEAFAKAGFQVDAASDGTYARRVARDTAYASLTLEQAPPVEVPVSTRMSPLRASTTAAFTIANVLCKPLRRDEVSSALARFRLGSDGRANVLLIDDEETCLDLMRASLKSIGVDSVGFLDGRVALQEIDRWRPDAIVLDLMMPVFDGFQVLDALQKLPLWRDVPVFIWTSMLLTDEDYATLARSARAILRKGGGAMEDMLDSVRHWRQPLAATTPGDPA